MKKNWKVAYRQGGRDRFRWVLIPTEFPTHGQAMLCMADLMRQGYHALVGDFRHGLPETFEGGESPDDFEVRDGWTYRRSSDQVG